VFLKLRPYVQSSLAPCSNHKLAYKFIGDVHSIVHGLIQCS
jgi:hypothetical protein